MTCVAMGYPDDDLAANAVKSDREPNGDFVVSGSKVEMSRTRRLGRACPSIWISQKRKPPLPV